MWETWVGSLGLEDPLEEGMATHSSIFAWRIPMDRGAWRATARGAAESDMTEWLSTVMSWTKILCISLQSDGQGPLRQALMYDYNNKTNENQVIETVSNMESELASSLQHSHRNTRCLE